MNKEEDLQDIESLFCEGGVLDREIPTYRPREEQVKMAQTVDSVLGGGRAILEAGTGIGKTFAYLAPIIESGLSVLISTGARGLQDQLIQKDIPLLAKALNRPVNVAVLKGRRNYVCRLAVETAMTGTLPEVSDSHTTQWKEIIDYTAQTQDGDIRGVINISPNAPIWEHATSSQETCTVQSCAHYNTCFLYKARAQARRADIVIVNHHLFLSDLRLRDEGIAELLPYRDVLLFDEAHMLPQLAPQYFGESLSTKRLLRTITIVERLLLQRIENADALITAANRLRRCVGDMIAVASGWDEARQSAAMVANQSDWKSVVDKLLSELLMFSGVLSPLVSDEDKTEKLWQRITADIDLLEQFIDVNDTMTNDDDAKIRWLEKRREHIELSITPLSGRPYFIKQWDEVNAVIFTSATLSVAGNFDIFCEEIGVSTQDTYRWDSPYDFANRSLLYLPKDLPLPNNPLHTQALVTAAIPLIRENGGRAFILFSSLRAMEEATAQLRLQLADDNLTILKQGEMPNDELLRQFRHKERVVLAGSQSFWQGIDVKGSALSLVIVDKIPFTPPNDPLLLARDEWRKSRGENPFLRNQLPPAVILMKQVAGRLMRDYEDYGIFMVGDTRLRTRGYGRTILNSLPPMKRCDNEEIALNFLRCRREEEDKNAFSHH